MCREETHGMIGHKRFAHACSEDREPNRAICTRLSCHMPTLTGRLLFGNGVNELEQQRRLYSGRSHPALRLGGVGHLYYSIRVNEQPMRRRYAKFIFITWMSALFFLYHVCLCFSLRHIPCLLYILEIFARVLVLIRPPLLHRIGSLQNLFGLRSAANGFSSYCTFGSSK